MSHKNLILILYRSIDIEKLYVSFNSEELNKKLAI